MTVRQWRVSALLFFSGLSALMYQTVWMREFRLIFGASTAATAAVLAIFMGGLAAGSALLGRRADAQERPLGYYARLELYIAGTAALTALLLPVAEKIYFASGGSPALGTFGATILRLVLAAIVIGPTTVLMGGTLPAAARAVETNDDTGRRGVALLYGINTFGAVAGALVATFFLIETVGNRTTLFVAMLANVLVALRARAMAAHEEPVDEIAIDETQERAVDPRLVYAAAGIVGFAFLLMELVWYRMLSPILGGTAYMFGLVLAMALLGIAAGGLSYALLRRGRPATVGAFALTCSLEALAVAVPFALGDQLAIFGGVMRQLGFMGGFGGHVLSWAIITTIVVFPAAFVSGIQLPLLIALLGRGRANVGRQIGTAYAWNTTGAIAGSLAGGFGLLPLLSAPVTWRLVAILLVAVAAVAVLHVARQRQRAYAVVTAVIAVLAIIASAATGPTALWRHTGIGVGRMPNFKNRNELRDAANHVRRAMVWQRDGRESSVSLSASDQYTFIVNGKPDGSARADASSQITMGLIGTMLHRDPKAALVIGLGTGQTAGWMARVPSVARVDVVELEPVVLDIARACAPVNAGAMSNPKVHITIADAREMLLATGRTYDVIVSEPSNPYRAGIASLLTSEFYQAVRDRLRPGGILAQWVQGYGIHPETMRTLYATLHATFPHVQTWWTLSGDMILVASQQPIVIDADVIRRRLATEPYASAFRHTWRVDTAEGFVARVVANEQFAAAAAAEAAALNTDDRTVVEFGFARSVGDDSQTFANLILDAVRLRATRPLYVRGALDWNAVAAASPVGPDLAATRTARMMALAQQGMLVEAEAFATGIAATQPADAMLILGAVRAKQQRLDEATELLRRGFAAAHADPWTDVLVLGEALEVATTVAKTSPQRARIMYDALAKPFPVRLQNTKRKYVLIAIAPLFDRCGKRAIAALHDAEPHPFWTLELLTIRANCYALAGDPLAADAWQDLETFAAAEVGNIVTPQKR